MKWCKEIPTTPRAESLFFRNLVSERHKISLPRKENTKNIKKRRRFNCVFLKVKKFCGRIVE